MSWYPVNIRLDDQPCVVIGGGSVAARKIEGLLAAGARVTVVAPEIGEAARSIVEAGDAEWAEKRYEKGDLDRYLLAVAATDDAEVNGRVYLDGEAAGVLVNSADDPESCRFILPAVLRRRSLVVSVSTGGRSPALAAHLRRRLESEYGAEWGMLTDLLGEAREVMRAGGAGTEGMTEKWEAAISGEILDLLRDGDIGGARREIAKCL